MTNLLKKHRPLFPFKTHGKSRHPLYRVWCAMRDRCYRKTDKRYIRYGGRGITVCKAWLSNFSSFYKWCILNGWQKGLQIDRKKNDGNYSPSNCRFVEQKYNIRNSAIAKLNLGQVIIIRKRYSTGESQKNLSNTFGVSISTVNRIVRLLLWV